MKNKRNNYAISEGGVARALQVGGGVLHAYGVSLKDSIAMITAANEPLQDPAKVGNGLRTIAMRLSGVSAKAKDGSVHLNQTGMALKEIAGVDVYSDKKTGQVKSMVEILDEVHAKWGTLRDDERKALAESIAGKNRANVFTALMSNYDHFKKIRSEFARGDEFGSAEAENSKYVNSIEGKINALKESLTSLMVTAVKSPLVYGALDVLKGITNGFENLITVADKHNLQLPMLFGGYMGLKTLFNGLKTSVISMEDLMFGDTSKGTESAYDKLKGKVKNILGMLPKSDKNPTDKYIPNSSEDKSEQNILNKQNESLKKQNELYQSNTQLINENNKEHRKGSKEDFEKRRARNLERENESLRRRNTLYKESNDISTKERLSSNLGQGGTVEIKKGDRGSKLQASDFRFMEKDSSKLKEHKLAIENENRALREQQGIFSKNVGEISKGSDKIDESYKKSKGSLEGTNKEAKNFSKSLENVNPSTLEKTEEGMKGIGKASEGVAKAGSKVSSAFGKIKETGSNIGSKVLGGVGKLAEGFMGAVTGTVLSGLAMYGVTKTAEVLYNKYQKLTHGLEQQKEQHVESRNAIREENNQLKSNIDYVKKNANAIETLHKRKKAITDTPESSRSAEQNKELENIEAMEKRLSTIAPNMVARYDENGNPIMRMNLSAKELTKSLEVAQKFKQKVLDNKNQLVYDDNIRKYLQGEAIGGSLESKIKGINKAIEKGMTLTDKATEKASTSQKIIAQNIPTSASASGQLQGTREQNEYRQLYSKLFSAKDFDKARTEFDKGYSKWKENMDKKFAESQKAIAEYDKLSGENANIQLDMLSRNADFTKFGKGTQSGLMELGSMFQWGKIKNSKSAIDSLISLGKKVSPQTISSIATELGKLKQNYMMDKDYKAYSDGVDNVAKKIANLTGHRYQLNSLKDSLKDIDRGYASVEEKQEIEYMRRYKAKPSDTLGDDANSMYAQKVQERYRALKTAHDNFLHATTKEDKFNELFQINQDSALSGGIRNVANALVRANSESKTLSNDASLGMQKLLTAMTVLDPTTKEAKQGIQDFFNALDKGQASAIDFGNGIKLSTNEMGEFIKAGLKSTDVGDMFSQVNKQIFSRVDDFYKNYKGKDGKAVEVPIEVKMRIADAQLTDKEMGSMEKVIQDWGLGVEKANDFRSQMAEYFAGTNGSYQEAYKNMAEKNEAIKGMIGLGMSKALEGYNPKVKELANSYHQLTDAMKENVNSLNGDDYVKYLETFSKLNDGVKNLAKQYGISDVQGITSLQGYSDVLKNSGVDQMTANKVIKVTIDTVGVEGMAKITETLNALPKEKRIPIVAELSGKNGAEASRGLGALYDALGGDTNKITKTISVAFQKTGDMSFLEKLTAGNVGDFLAKLQIDTSGVGEAKGQIDELKDPVTTPVTVTTDGTVSEVKGEIDGIPNEKQTEVNVQDNGGAKKVNDEVQKIPQQKDVTVNMKVPNPEKLLVDSVNKFQAREGGNQPQQQEQTVKVKFEADTSDIQSSLDALKSTETKVKLSADVGDIISKTSALSNKQVNLKIHGDTSELNGKINALSKANATVHIKGDLSSALESIHGLESTSATIKINADTGAMASQLNLFSNKTVKVNVKGDTSSLSQSISALSGKTAKVTVSGDVSSVSSSISALSGKNVQVTVTGDASSVSSAISSLSGQTVTINVNADTSTVRGSLQGISGQTVKINISGDTSKVSSAVNSVKNMSAKVTVTADTSSLSSSISSATTRVTAKVRVTADTTSARASINGIGKSKSVKIKATADVSSARSSINSLKGKTITIRVRVNMPKISMPKISNKSATVKVVDNATASAKKATSAVNGFPTKTRSATLRVIDNATASARRATAAVNSFPTGSRTMTLITRYKTEGSPPSGGGGKLTNSIFPKRKIYDEGMSKLEMLKKDLSMRVGFLPLIHRPTQMNPLATEYSGVATTSAVGGGSTTIANNITSPAGAVSTARDIISIVEKFQHIDFEKMVYKQATAIGKLKYNAVEMGDALKYDIDLLREMDSAIAILNGKISIIDTRLKNATGSRKYTMLGLKDDYVREEIRRLNTLRKANEDYKLFLRDSLKKDGVNFTQNGQIESNSIAKLITYKKKLEQLNEQDGKTTKKNAKANQKAREKEIKDLERKIKKFEEYQKYMMKEIEIDGMITKNQEQLKEDADERQRIVISAWRENFEAVSKVLDINLKKISQKLEIYDIKFRYAFGYDRLNLIKAKADGIKEYTAQLDKNIVSLKRSKDNLKEKLKGFGFHIQGDEITNYQEHLAQLKDTSTLYDDIKGLANEYLDILHDKLPNANKQLAEYNSKLKDLAKQRLEDTKAIEDKITAMYKKQIDERLKAIEKVNRARDEEIRKRKEEYNLARKEADYQDEYHKKLKDIEKLERRRDIYRRDTSQKGQKELQKINKDLEKSLDDLQKTVGKHIDDKVNKIYDDELKNLGDESKTLRERYETEYSDAELLKKAQESIQTGMFRGIDGKVQSLQTALINYINEFEGGLSATGSLIQGELISKLEVANDTVRQFKETLDTLGTSHYNSGGYIQYDKYTDIADRKTESTNVVHYNSPLVYINGSTDSQMTEEIVNTVKKAMDRHMRELKGSLR